MSWARRGAVRAYGLTRSFAGHGAGCECASVPSVPPLDKGERSWRALAFVVPSAGRSHGPYPMPGRCPGPWFGMTRRRWKPCSASGKLSRRLRPASVLVMRRTPRSASRRTWPRRCWADRRAGEEPGRRRSRVARGRKAARLDRDHVVAAEHAGRASVWWSGECEIGEPSE